MKKEAIKAYEDGHWKPSPASYRPLYDTVLRSERTLPLAKEVDPDA